PAGDGVGMDLGVYVEGTGVGPYEGAHVQVLVSGKVVASTGIPTQGQGHATVFAQMVADHLGVEVSDVEVVSGDTRRFQWGGGTEKATPFQSRARPGPPLADGDQPGLEATGFYSPPGSTWAAGCHAAYVRIDPKTFRMEILRYVVVHDCGRVINPLVLEGQVEGGVAQGIGGAFYERLVYD